MALICYGDHFVSNIPGLRISLKCGLYLKLDLLFSKLIKYLEFNVINLEINTELLAITHKIFGVEMS